MNSHKTHSTREFRILGYLAAGPSHHSVGMANSRNKCMAGMATDMSFRIESKKTTGEECVQ